MVSALTATLPAAFTATGGDLDLITGWTVALRTALGFAGTLPATLTGALAADLAGALAADLPDALTTDFTALTGLAGDAATLGAGLAFTEAGAATLAAGLALTATLGAALLAAPFTDDLLDVFTSCLLAVQLTRTECASPSHRTQGVHLHQNP